MFGIGSYEEGEEIYAGLYWGFSDFIVDYIESEECIFFIIFYYLNKYIRRLFLFRLNLLFGSRWLLLYRYNSWI